MAGQRAVEDYWRRNGGSDRTRQLGGDDQLRPMSITDGRVSSSKLRETESIANAIRGWQAALLLIAVAAFVSPVALPDPLQLGIQLSTALVGVVASALICLPELAAGRWPRTPLDVLMVGYVAIVLLTGAIGVDPWQTWKAMLTVAAEVGLFYGAVIVARGTRSAGALLLVLAIGTAVVELLAFGYHLEVGLATRPAAYLHPVGWSGYPELGALATLQFGVFIAALLRVRRPLHVIAMTALALIAGIQILFLYSRGTWVAAIVVMAAAVLLGERHRKSVLVGALGIAMVLAALAWVNPTARTLAGNLIGAGPAAGAPRMGLATPGMRVSLWVRSLAMIRDYPVHGVGLGNFRTVFETRYNPELNNDQRRGVHAHNLWLQRTAEFGIPGGLWFAALWGSGLVVAWQAARRRHSVVQLGVFLALAGTTISNAIDNVPSLVAGQRVYLLTWILFGLAASAAVAEPEPSEVE